MVKCYWSLLTLTALTSALPALAANPRLASGPTGDAVCVQADSTAVWAYYNSDPLTQAWSAGTSVSLPLSQGMIIHLPDVTYAGDGRFIVGWVVYPNQVYSAYTDGGGVWSSPAMVGELGPSHRATALRIAADSAGTVLLYCSGQSGNSYGLYSMRSVDSGITFSAPGLQQDSNGVGINATTVNLATNGSGSWYRAYTEFHRSGGLIPTSYGSRVQTSLDGGLSWGPGFGVTGSISNSKMLLGRTAITNRASFASYYGDTMIGGKFTFTNTADNGGNWLNTLLPLKQPYFFGPLDYPGYLNQEGEMATDTAGNTVIVYKSKYTDANDSDLLSFRSVGSSLIDWNTTLTYVSRQIDRNESANALTTLGENKFLTAFDVADAQNPSVHGIQTALSTDAGASWTTGPFITGNLTVGELREYVIPQEPQLPTKFVISSVTPKIKYKEPKPGKPPKPRKATFKIVIGTTPALTSPEGAELKIYLSDNETLELAQETQLYSGTTKAIKVGKTAKLNLKFNDFPDSTGKYILIQVGTATPYVLTM